MGHSRWNLLPAIPDQDSLSGCGLHPLVAQLLYNRGVAPAHLEAFLNGDWRLGGDPFLLPGMPGAVSRVYRALLSGESITIYGDFDADGVTATALLVQGLTALGGKVAPYIPHRQTEGYGLSIAALEGLRQQGVSLVITVDCGITNVAQVKRANRIGLDVVITDHHVPLAEIPPACAVVNPKLAGSAYPFADLAGVGVAFKFLQALLRSLGKDECLNGLFDLVALGTIADMSPLVGENRYLVKEGLRVMNSLPRIGIKEMTARAGLNHALGSEEVSWILAPRINAAGRIAHASASYNLLMSQSAEEAAKLAAWLDEKNTQRHEMTAAALTRAREQVLAQPLTPLLVAGDRDYPVGVAGLVASRLVEEFYRPAIVVRVGERTSSGSCRSIPEFNIVAALTECQPLLTQYGGHSQAAGFSLLTRNLPALELQLKQIAEKRLAGTDLRPRLDIDARVSLADLGGETFRLTQTLAPFGRGNPVPVFLSHDVEVIDCRLMGSGGEHLRFKLRQGGATWSAVCFDLGCFRAEIKSHLDIVYNVEVDRWNGEERLRLNILDFAPAG